MTKERERKAEVNIEPHERRRVNNIQKRINTETHLQRQNRREAENRGARGRVRIEWRCSL